MTTLHLVRHGQASAGTHDYDRLSELGREQARLLGVWWAEHGFSPDLVCNGDLLRQRDTASIALNALGTAEAPPHQHQHTDLNEYNHDHVDSIFGQGACSAGPALITFEEYFGTMQRWQQANHELPDGIESWQQFASRGWNAVQSVYTTRGDAENLVFFTSGGVIATLVAQVLGLDFSHTIDAIWRIRNASVTTLHYDGEHARLIEFNTVPHLQTRKNPDIITLI